MAGIFKSPFGAKGAKEWFFDIITHQNDFKIGPDSVIKHYGSARTRAGHRMVTLVPLMTYEHSSPYERCSNEEYVLRYLSGMGVPVPRVIGCGPDYLEMNKIEGLPLSKVYPNPNVSREDKLQITSNAGELVRKMHDAGIVHGDLFARQIMVECPELEDGKLPENLGESKLHLIDFELVPKKFGPEGRAIDNIFYTLTASCYSGIPFREVRSKYEEGYGSGVDSSFFDQALQANTCFMALGISPRSMSGNYWAMRGDFLSERAAGI
ncbi:MAG: phosphotransferase [Candidatus Aenigmarchaeota archaeon]|nr:phosphotransferase [Candidatus Aenigmarchaeota archaeon]